LRSRRAYPLQYTSYVPSERPIPLCLTPSSSAIRIVQGFP
jgi:hypothetical protein